MPTISVLDSAGNPQPVELPNANGRKAAALSRPVTLSDEDLAAIQALATAPLPAGTNDMGTVHIAGTVSVTGAYQATQPVSGPLTDAQLRTAPVPVSGSFFPATQPVSIASMPSTPVTGTFWQATQPVSIASQPLPTGAATETTLAAIGTKTPALGQAVMASSSPVVIASNQSALPVTGAFFQATQPVSLASQPLPTGAATEATLAKIDQATAWTDKSLTLTGSSQTLFTSVTAGSIQERFIANPSANSIWVNMVGGTAAANAAGSFEISPGSFFSTSCTNAITVIGTSTQKVTAGER